MNEMVPLNELASVLWTEGRGRLFTLCVIFAVIALAALAASASLWPKKYVASTTILVQESDIIKPLLEGRASTTGVADRAGIARQVIFSRKVMNDILNTGGWMDKHPARSSRTASSTGSRGAPRSRRRETICCRSPIPTPIRNAPSRSPSAWLRCSSRRASNPNSTRAEMRSSSSIARSRRIATS